MNEEIRHEIVRRRQGGASIRRIARDLNLARDTVQSVIRRWEADRSGQGSTAPATRRPSLVDPFHDTIRQLLERYPEITTQRVLEELRLKGFTGVRVHRETKQRPMDRHAEERPQLLPLRVQDFDLREEVLRIEATKFHKSRLVPLPASVAVEVRRYLERRGGLIKPDAPLLCGNPGSSRESAYCAHALADNWRLLCLSAGVLDERGRPPRLHDMRHSYAVAALDHWYRQGVDVSSKLPHLATYMGHVSIVSTHYYLRLAPELGQSASRRFHQYAGRLFTPGGAP